MGEDLLNKTEIIINKLNEDENKGIYGVGMLIRRIKAEVSTLTTLKENESLSEHHIKCSNLHSLFGIYELMSRISNTKSVFRKFRTKAGEKISVDIVGDNGSCWYKLILRNPKNLHQIYLYGDKNGTAPLDKVAEKYLKVAEDNQYMFCNPKIVFIFRNGVSKTLANALEVMGVQIRGIRIEDEALDVTTSDSIWDFLATSPSLDSVNQLPITASNEGCPIEDNYDSVNLDVTCLIAYTSEVSNGGCHGNFVERFLKEQVEMEKSNAIKPVLDKYFENKKLIICEEVADHFKTILSTLGGAKENERGMELLERCQIVKSVDVLKDTIENTFKITELSRKTFGTGVYYSAPTVTSNLRFIRSAEQKGLSLAVLCHDPRALTELKTSLTE